MFCKWNLCHYPGGEFGCCFLRCCQWSFSLSIRWTRNSFTGYRLGFKSFPWFVNSIKCSSSMTISHLLIAIRNPSHQPNRKAHNRQTSPANKPQHCRSSLLSHCVLYASSSSASQAYFQRRDSIAAMRVSSLCHREECAQPQSRPNKNKKCQCMESLLRATKPSITDIDGFYHCADCLLKALVAMQVANSKILHFKTVGGKEVFAVWFQTRGVFCIREYCFSQGGARELTMDI